MNDVAVRAQNLSKRFIMQHERRTALKERFVRGKAPKGKEFWALRDASFEVPKGSMFGIIGHNGSGKSTALKVVAGIYRPTSGMVQVNGRMSALLELGAGFHPELTGRENIALNGSILGMSRKQIEEQTEEIIDFAGISGFIDSPVKTYSSGMYVRLGFAIAVKVDPEVLVIDEVIAVGDEDFQRKCFDYIADLRNRGSTVIIVSHALGIVSEACDAAMWLDHGEVQVVGPAREVVDAYLKKVNDAEAALTGLSPSQQLGLSRRGSGEILVTGIEYLDGDGRPMPFLVNGEACGVRLSYLARKEVDGVVFGLNFFNSSNINVAGATSASQGHETVQTGAGVVEFSLPAMPLSPGKYTVSTAVVTRTRFIDLVDLQVELTVRNGGTIPNGLVRLTGDWRRSEAEADPQVLAALGEPVEPETVVGFGSPVPQRPAPAPAG
ncbi:MAG: lipopolysaccharide transport system ATP-binding protein [Actinomycetota bacterium]|nr:lipopolysaccharide transport system ATP-binding protein [Actinomycetota bacterium]